MCVSMKTPNSGAISKNLFKWRICKFVKKHSSPPPFPSLENILVAAPMTGDVEFLVTF